MRLLFLITMAAATHSYGDSPMMETPLVFTATNSSSFFLMIPEQTGTNRETIKEPFGIMYRVEEDGSLKESYRTTGWYSFEVFVSEDGKYLVQMGPWSVGNHPTHDDLAVAFHENGKLIKSYSTADLIKDSKKISVSTSHYQWLAPHSDWEATPAQYYELSPKLDYQNRFSLNTIDNRAYSFDATTGAIVAVSEFKPPASKKKSIRPTWIIYLGTGMAVGIVITIGYNRLKARAGIS